MRGKGKRGKQRGKTTEVVIMENRRRRKIPADTDCIRVFTFFMIWLLIFRYIVIFPLNKRSGEEFIEKCKKMSK